jgi:hypothetical protein
MSRGKDQTAERDDTSLDLFEIPNAFIRPAVVACRLFNTAVDAVFYDVLTLRAELSKRDVTVRDRGEKPSRIIDFSALSDPEGSLLLIDAQTDPYVQQFHDVDAYLNSTTPEAAIATITGVGSSALGSAALAWNISTALKQPVLAIVPGYGVADMVLQGLGGWFGFGLHDFLGTKSVTQNAIANVAPNVAAIGRNLSASVPDAETLQGAPVFRYGSGSSDVLHALMKDRPSPFKILVGHSKGALQIGNALRSLDADRTRGVCVVTLGCPIAEDAPGAVYHQYLGLFDALGQLNMWGHWPEQWTRTWHSTNPALPPAMAAGPLAAKSASALAKRSTAMALVSSAEPA